MYCCRCTHYVKNENIEFADQIIFANAHAQKRINADETIYQYFLVIFSFSFNFENSLQNNLLKVDQTHRKE